MSENLRPCPACQQEIAKSAQTCPHCGKAFTSPLTIIIAVIAAIIIAWKIIG